MRIPEPTLDGVAEARKKFIEQVDPTNLFYRAATKLVELALSEAREADSLTLAEAVGVLLKTWNDGFYRFGHAKFDKEHLGKIQELMDSPELNLLSFRERSLESLHSEEESSIKTTFESFEKVLGTIGAAKCLHLLAPQFFPLWDRDIAHGYQIYPQKRGTNGENYVKFVNKTREQIEKLKREGFRYEDPLKALDEYNWIHAHQNKRRKPRQP